MTADQEEWAYARNELVQIIVSLGFPKELGEQIAKQLGSPKAIRRMSGYLSYEKPDRVEVIVDEMLAIREEIAAWHEKKACEETNARINELMRRR